MDFDIEQVNTDIPKAKRIVLAGNDPYTYERHMTFIAKGFCDGVVHSYGSAAVKRKGYAIGGAGFANYMNAIAFIENYIRKSEIGMEREIHFAPCRDYATKQDDDSRHTYAFMPKIDGVTIKSLSGLEKLLGIGTGGLKTFFEDIEKAFDIGFFPDTMPESDNCIVTPKHINMIDFFIHNRNAPISPEDRQSLNGTAVDIILEHWHTRIVALKNKDEAKNLRKMFLELAGNTESALSHIKDNSHAKAKVQAYRESDFPNKVNF